MEGKTPSGVRVIGYLKPITTVYPESPKKYVEYMTVILYWVDRWSDGNLYPEARTSNINVDFKGLIFSFLNDDEGHGLIYLSNWIDKGLIEIEKIKRGELESYDMWGHAWGAEMTNKNVLIYWGYDDTPYEEEMTFGCFYKIINEWGKFLKTEPNLNNVIEFDC